MANFLQEIGPRVRELEFRERVDQLCTYCFIEQSSRNQQITLVASLVIAILALTLCAIYSIVIAIPCAYGTLMLSLYVFDKVKFPCDAYNEVISDLNKNQFGFSYEFARFAEERGLLSPETVVEAHQIFKQHQALLAQNQRGQLRNAR